MKQVNFIHTNAHLLKDLSSSEGYFLRESIQLTGRENTSNRIAKFIKDYDLNHPTNLKHISGLKKSISFAELKDKENETKDIYDSTSRIERAKARRKKSKNRA